ncbi:hypothetical protein BOTCAL_1744g00010 [Botryotinia calthae]|uniref:Uncharacterized protein n=1 Tax=Botryotinia calthae TaxID=38488 RepID=A0A4Y8CD98_9HELO|nr:hypothetical protein BOTCAL_1744g00010 [Botryotinia calthae]
MLLIVPPDTNFDTTTPRLISNIGSLSRLDASAIHDAGLSDSVHVICLQFDLIIKGLILTKKKNTTAIKPRNYTSKELIRGFESLSDTKTFTMYIKPNDYALVGLEEICNRLSKTDTPIDIYTIKEIYVEQTPELVEWSRLYLVSLLPSYTKNPQPSPEIQVPLLPIIFEQDTPLITTIEVVIVETPDRTSISFISILVHSIFSPSCGELLDGEVNLDDMEKHLRYIEMDFDIDLDEEQFATFYSQKLSQQFLNDTARTIALNISYNKNKYYNQKSACIVYILTEFGKLGNNSSSNSDNKKNNKTVCRKRKGLGTYGTTSKLIKM